MHRSSAIHIVPTLLLLFLQVVASDLVAQDTGLPTEEKWRVGGHVSLGLLDYDADMSGLPGVPNCCPGYEDGSGLTVGVGFVLEIPLAEELSLASRLLFGRSSGRLEADEEELVTRGTDTVRATFRHTIEASRPAILIEELILFRPIENLFLMGGIGLDLAAGGSFQQEEQIASPDDIRYADDKRRRLLFEGSLPNESTLSLSLLGGVRYDLEVNPEGSFILSPEILYWHGMSNLVQETNWTMWGVRFGVTLSWVRIGEGDRPSPLGPG